MYGKFNNRDRHMSLMQGSKKGLAVINKSFKETLDEVQTKVEIDHVVEQVNNTDDMEVVLLWQEAIHKNYLKNRGY